MANHPITHIEISSKDHAKMKDFYGKLFGWSFQDFPDVNYVTFTTGEGQTGGGFSPVSNGAPPGAVVPYVDTSDIDAMLATVKALGGGVVTLKTEIPGLGYYAVFTDLSGNQIGLFESADQR